MPRRSCARLMPLPLASAYGPDDGTTRVARQAIRRHTRVKGGGQATGPSNLTGCELGSGAPVGVALSAVQDTTEMPAQRPDRLPVPREGIAVVRAHDHGPDGPIICARRGKHRGRKSVALCIA